MPLIRPASPRAEFKQLSYQSRRSSSDDSMPAELCDGPIDDGAGQQTSPQNVSDGRSSPLSDREELIRRIKNGERPRWSPSAQLARLSDETAWENGNVDVMDMTSSGDITGARPRPELVKNGGTSTQDHQESSRQPSQAGSSSAQLNAGNEIQRPRSALHAGDFSTRQQDTAGQHRETGSFVTAPLATSPPMPRVFPATSFQPVPKQALRLAFSGYARDSQPQSAARPRAPSLQSGSPSYILKPPTSPLVRGTTNDDLDLEDAMQLDSPSRRSHRRTLTPVGSIPIINSYSTLTQAARQPASLRKENTFPWQGYHPSPSFASSWSRQAATSPPARPGMRARAPSQSSDASPRQTSMVGSYEESILRGRMSGTPSHPLNFTAELGAISKNGHKPVCPPHVHVEFPAVYYSWTSGQGRVSSINQEPSPYVGRIDLESSLPPPKGKDKRRERRQERQEPNADEATFVFEDGTDTTRTQKKRKRRDPSPKESLLGGCYRIPQQGSLQIIIRNPNKSAAKVFIVPYDLDGMEPGTRTWIRQRCYSAGPIIEKALTNKPTNASEDGKLNSRNDNSSGNGSIISSSVSAGSGVSDKPTLRYLIHLKICSPSRGRFYLYDEIRVVFANRVPDNKEKLQSTVQMPDPKFTPFKPQRTGNSSQQSRPPSESSTTCPPKADDDKAFRRRSYGLAFPSNNEITGVTDSRHETPVPPIPANFKPLRPRSHTTGMNDPESRSTADSDAGLRGAQASVHEYWVDSNGGNGRKGEMARAFADSLASDTNKSFQPSNIFATRPDADGGQGRSMIDNNGSINTTGPAAAAVPSNSGSTHISTPASPSSLAAEARSGPFAKLAREDARYGGRPATPEPGEGLIARRLRGLDVEERED